MNHPPKKPYICLIIHKTKRNIPLIVRGEPLQIKVPREEFPYISYKEFWTMMLKKLSSAGFGEGYYVLRNTNNNLQEVVGGDVDEFDLLEILE